MSNLTTNKARYTLLKEFYEGNTFKVMLVSDSHTNDNAHDFVDDVSANEVTEAAVDGAYARVEITGITVSENDAGDKPKVTADSVTFLNLNTTESIGAIIVYRENNDDTDSVIVNEVDTLIPAGSSSNILPKATDGTDLQLTIAQLLGLTDA